MMWRYLVTLLLTLMLAACGGAASEPELSEPSPPEGTSPTIVLPSLTPSQENEDQAPADAVPTAAIPPARDVTPVATAAGVPLFPTSTTESDATLEPSGQAPSSLAEQATTLVAEETGLPEAEFSVARQERVVWNDSSLGCPQPGQSYLQVLTPGYQIVVEGGGNTYYVHGDERGKLFLCGNPQPPGPQEPPSRD